MLRGKNVRNVVCVLAMVGLAFCTMPAGADVISPLNGSFEADNANGGWSGGFLSQTPTNWQNSALTSAGQAVSLLQPTNQGNPNYATPVNGITVLELWSNGAGIPGMTQSALAGVQQDLGTMVSGHKYTFAATLFSNVNVGSWRPEWSWASNYRISLYNATDSRELAAITQADFDPSAGGTLALQKALATFNYTATAVDSGDTLRLIMDAADAGTGATAYRTGVDGVSLTTTIPEPGTLALLGTALAGLLAYAWRRRK